MNKELWQDELQRDVEKLGYFPCKNPKHSLQRTELLLLVAAVPGGGKLEECPCRVLTDISSLLLLHVLHINFKFYDFSSPSSTWNVTRAIGEMPHIIICQAEDMGSDRPGPPRLPAYDVHVLRDAMYDQ